VNPASGGDSQRCVRARLIERARPPASNSTTARWTVRWLASRQCHRLRVERAGERHGAIQGDQFLRIVREGWKRLVGCPAGSRNRV
jgi:hypothetical protein